MKSYREIWNVFRQKFERVSLSAESDFRWLVEHEAGLHGFSLQTHGDRFPKVQNKLLEMLERRAAGEPVAYILGSWEFYSRSFDVGPGVLVPRPETELIIDLGKRIFSKDQSLKIVDFGAGSGCIGITLALEFKSSHTTLVEKSAEAYSYLIRNILNHGLDKSDQITCVNMDVEKWFGSQEPETFDLVVANPPYISIDDDRVDAQVKKYEPGPALFSGEGGYAHLKSWSKIAASLLRSGGAFICELGLGQHDKAVSYVTSLSEFGNVEVESDLGGIPRTLMAIKN